jgi:hypothetical protein
LVVRLRHAVIDITVVVILAGFCAAFLVARNDQTRHDDEARAIATWAREQGVTRIAWPEDLRESVPTLVGERVTPILVNDSDIVPQNIAVNRTPVVVTRAGGNPGVPALDSFRAGALVAQLVDLSVAGGVPLAGDDSAGEEIARPYVYAPLRDSRRIAAGSPFTTRLVLSPGEYVVAIEAFDVERGSRLRITAATGFRSLTDVTRQVENIVREPTIVSFSVPRTVAVSVRLRFIAVGGHNAAVLIHRWSIERVGHPA